MRYSGINALVFGFMSGISAILMHGGNWNTPKRIRTAAAGVKGRCPRPLDDGGILAKYSRDRVGRQYPDPQCVRMLPKIR